MDRCVAILRLSLVCGLANAGVQTLEDGLVVYYPFNGNFDDSSVNMQMVDNRGGVGFVPGAAGLAASFDGIDDQLFFPGINNDFLMGVEFSITFWFRFDTAPVVNYSLLSKRDACFAGNFFDIRADGVNINFEIGQPAGSSAVRSGITLGEWTFYAAVADGSSQLLYLNGIPAVDMSSFQSIDLSAVAVPLGFSTSPCIGLDGTEMFEGAVDELRVYDRPLSETEVEEIYRGTIFSDSFE